MAEADHTDGLVLPAGELEDGGALELVLGLEDGKRVACVRQTPVGEASAGGAGADGDRCEKAIECRKR